MLKKIITLILICYTAQSFSQGIPLAIGSWRQHIPYKTAIAVTETDPGVILAASRFGLFSYNKNTSEINLYTKLSALSDYEISKIGYDRQTKVLLIAYDNANIDLMFEDGSVYNIPDIKIRNIVGGKNINDITFVNGRAYLSCQFGIVVINISRREISDTYYIGTNGGVLEVNSVAFNGSDFIAATDSGLYRANINDPNIFNYLGWTKETALASPTWNYSSVAALQGTFYAIKKNATVNGDSILKFSNNSWTAFLPDLVPNSFVNADDNYLYYITSGAVKAFDVAGNYRADLGGYQNVSVTDGFQDRDGDFWASDLNNGLVRKRPDNSISYIVPNGPATEAVLDMKASNGRLWVVTGANIGDSPDYTQKNGIFLFSDNSWKSFGCNNDTVYQYLCAFGSPSVTAVAIDPDDADHAFIGAWGNGLLEYKSTGGVARYNQYNSPLAPMTSFNTEVRIGSLGYDSERNLWGITSSARAGIFARKPNGTIRTFNIPDGNVAGFNQYKLVIDDFGQKWFITRQGSSTPEGMCVFQENSIDNPTITKFRRLNASEGSGNLPDLYVRDIAKDKDGAIWIGTNQGVGVIYNPANALTGSGVDAQKILITQDGYNQYLLESEIVTAIAVDGGNRKWFGTYSGGAFLMSPDGTQQLLKFNTQNSPLLSNSINAIAIDDQSGEVFFGTDKGIISYRSDATEGDSTCKDQYVFPNPVTHDYSGPIAIKGLITDSDVRVSDVAGNIVFRTKSNGGQAIWNGNDFSGNRVQTGVYTVWITNNDGSQTCVTKVLLAN